MIYSCFPIVTQSFHSYFGKFEVITLVLSYILIMFIMYLLLFVWSLTALIFHFVIPRRCIWRLCVWTLDSASRRRQHSHCNEVENTVWLCWHTWWQIGELILWRRASQVMQSFLPFAAPLPVSSLGLWRPWLLQSLQTWWFLGCEPFWDGEHWRLLWFPGL